MRSLFFYTFLFISSYSFGIKGWHHIESNQYGLAKTSFLNELKVDSTNLEALGGMIYLSEVAEDVFSFRKYVNKYVKVSKDPYFYTLFHELIEGSIEGIQHNTSSILYKLEKKASKEKELYHYKEQRKTLRLINQKLNWSFIGPFQSIQGSGHITEYEIEKTLYDSSKSYSTHLGSKVKWVFPSQTNEEQDLRFDEHLASVQSGTYYANSFFFVDSTSNYQLRLRRSRPIKLWVDDQLVYDNADTKTGSFWDNEIINLSFEKGSHRLLIKSSDYQPSKSSFDLFNFEDSQEAKKTNFDLFFELENESFVKNYLSIRFTDTLGNLSNNISPYDYTDYGKSKASVSIETDALQKHFLNKCQSNCPYFDYYLLAKTLLKSGKFNNGEEYFYYLLKKNKSKLFFQHLVSKFYSVNGKIEKVYESINDIESHDTFFALLKKNYEEIDQNTDENSWFDAINSLLSLNPSDVGLINEYLEYLNENGLEKEKEDFKKRTIAYDPSLEDVFDDVLDDFFSQKGTNKKRIKTLDKRLSHRFSDSDWDELSFLLESDNVLDKLYEVYQLKFTHNPSDIKPLLYLSKLYIENKDLRCLDILEEIKRINPYNQKLHMLYGKAYELLSDYDLAYKHYSLAKEYGFGYYTGSLLSKIEQYGDNSNKKELFSNKEILDSDWKNFYKDHDDVILKYTKEVLFREDLNPLVFQDMIIQIITEEGVKKWTEYNFNFLGNIRHIVVVKKDGSEVRPDIQYGHAVFKNLQAGDKIKVSGKSTLSSSKQLLGNYFFYNYMNFETPVHYSKLEIATQKNQLLNYHVFKFKDNLEKREGDSLSFYKWEYTDLPPVVIEEASTSKYDLYCTIMISTLKDWEEIVDWYQKETYRITEPTYELKEVVDSLIDDRMSTIQKVEKLYNYITTNINYSYVSFLQSDFVPKRPENTLSSKIGDCKDVSSLMISMLRYAGVESNYVLVKTSAMGHKTILPSLFFDHVITSYQWNGQTYYIDLTTDHYNYRVLPSGDVDQPCLVIKEEGDKLKRLPNDYLSSDKSHAEYVISAILDEDRSVKTRVLAKYNGTKAGYLRERLSLQSSEEKKIFLSKHLEFQDKLILEKYRFDDIHAVSGPLTAYYHIRSHRYTDKIFNYKIFKIPFIQKYSFNSIFREDKRFNLIDLKKITEINPAKQKIEVEIPEGRRLVQKLNPITIEGRFGKYTTTFKKKKQTLIITNTRQFYEQFIHPRDYQAFKQFYIKLIEADEQFIAIRKIK